MQKKNAEKYPEEVITHDRKGNPEVRTLLDKGQFVRYHYANPKTGRLLEKGKFTILLKNERGELIHFYAIPMQQGKRYLLIEVREKVIERKVWDARKKKAVELW
ncbi:MAG: hypothetical protein J4415_01445 [Candidatus Diapherotrites archaeon]|uniref:Uncharacterized protein n=1 Tax=Candidatus Iainarchaeum sp. TaxID=3101447 RepID=A0A8T4KTK0_9ARCH|nr:hypothetical protein [Candidatus Diapherotrites archaeon]